MGVLASAPAKINLTMHIEGRREDGYHLVHTVMQALDLRETVEVWEREQSGITLTITGADLKDSENNTARKAVRAFFAATGLPERGYGIYLNKCIPMGAGLAGGSADAAAVIVALNELTGAGLNTQELCSIGAHVGADVPFCILGGTATGTGTGTILSPLPPLPDCTIIVAKPPDGISTPEAYRLIDSASSLPDPASSRMEEAICEGDLHAVGCELCNAFDTVTTLPGVNAIKSVMRTHHTLGCQMTGSGSAVFGLFDEADRAKRCARELRRQYHDVFLCVPDRRGAYIESKE